MDSTNTPKHSTPSSILIPLSSSLHSYPPLILPFVSFMSPLSLRLIATLCLFAFLSAFPLSLPHNAQRGVGGRPCSQHQQPRQTCHRSWKKRYIECNVIIACEWHVCASKCVHACMHAHLCRLLRAQGRYVHMLPKCMHADLCTCMFLRLRWLLLQILRTDLYMIFLYNALHRSALTPWTA